MVRHKRYIGVELALNDTSITKNYYRKGVNVIEKSDMDTTFSLDTWRQVRPALLPQSPLPPPPKRTSCIKRV